MDSPGGVRFKKHALRPWLTRLRRQDSQPLFSYYGVCALQSDQASREEPISRRFPWVHLHSSKVQTYETEIRFPPLCASVARSFLVWTAGSNRCKKLYHREEAWQDHPGIQGLRGFSRF